jgi:hypothetical protein
MVLGAIEQYGLCPMVLEELPKLRLIGKAIIRKHDTALAIGKRKDIRVER